MKQTWREAALIIAGLVGVSAFVLTRAPGVEAQSGQGTPFTCSADNIGATLTRLTGCTAPDPGLTFYVTDIIAQSTTTTSGQFILRYGTGTNCGTGTTSLFPSAATAARIASPANTAAPTVIPFRTPLRVPDGKDVCVLGVATNTTTIQLVGYVGIK